MSDEAAAVEGYDFVAPLKDEYVCSVCLELLREPHLTSCCGQHFCKSCLENVLARGMRCPLCNQDFAAIIDRRIEREIRSLKVRCRYKSEGCDWVGNLRDLRDHLDAKTGPRRCLFSKLPCPKGCGQNIRHTDLNDHLQKDCPKRDSICEYCGERLFYDELNKHWGQCEKFPVSCPNGCEQRIPRNTLLLHQQHCPHQCVSCEFANIGCTEKVKRKDLVQHMQENTQKHLGMMSRLCFDLTKGMQETQFQVSQVTQQLQEKKREVTELRATLNKLQLNYQTNLQQQRNEFEARLRDHNQQLMMHVQLQIADLGGQAPLDRLQHRVQTLETLVSVPPYYFTLTNYALHKRGTTQWMCPPFYTELGGYKMAIEISANGEGAGKNTHVSVYIRIMRGEYDDQLQWPLRASVTIQLISQWNESHYEMTTPFYEWARVTDGVVGAGWGWDKFVSHREVEFNPATQTEYLKNDRLNFRVISVDRK